MLSILYTIFIFPIEFIIKQILELSHSITGSYGISIIIVSIIISTVTLPLYHLAEILQNKERQIKKKMEPEINEFKKVYKGYELHLYIKTLYKQNNYHPIYSLRASLGLLIQIPFFIAAYHFLSHYEAINGISFGFFKNLGEPDALISIGAITINILPFVMTIFNLIGGYIYGKGYGFKENIQMYIIAALFFVLLYNSPSGLLIYWTCNNIYSVFKHIGYKYFELRKLKTIKGVA